MLVCRRSSDGTKGIPSETPEENLVRPLEPGEGGPVFLPRRKPSMIAEALFAACVAPGTGAGPEKPFRAEG